MAKAKGNKNKKHNWPLLMEEWISQNMMPDRKPYSLGELAKKHNIHPVVLRRTAAKQCWSDILHKAKSETKTKASQFVDRSHVFNEVEVRVRHATYGRVAQEKAFHKLNSIDPEKLTVKEAYELLRIGSEIERKALGIPDAFTYSKAGEGPTDFTPDDARGVLSEILSLYRGADGVFRTHDDDSAESGPDHPEQDSGEVPQLVSGSPEGGVGPEEASPPKEPDEVH